MDELVLINFEEENFAPVSLEAKTSLCEQLNAENSPILFGCRTGICGTCLVELDSESIEKLAQPSQEEQEALEIYAPDNRRARLACQLSATCKMKLKYLGKDK